jgi:hypothetical protein
MSASVARRSRLADPRVETLVAWALKPEVPLDEIGRAAIAALADALPRGDAAPALALAAAAAYARVPLRGPRDLQAGHLIVDLLQDMGEPGACELVRLRERTSYQHPARRINAALGALARELRTPLGEFEDAFGGPVVDTDLSLMLPVGPYEAQVRIAADLRRVHTMWTGRSGRRLRSRPAGAAGHPDELAFVQAERRRLQAHLRDLRARLEQAMVTGRSWSTEQWAVRMFADPLRAALSRRLVWRIDVGGAVELALPLVEGLRDVDGRPVALAANADIGLWHPAETPELQTPWQRRSAALRLDQPIDQIGREVTHATACRLDFADRARVEQRAFRGFLMRRGWHVPYLGPWFAVPEATRELLPGGPIAVLHLDAGCDADDRVRVVDLAFRSAHGRDLDARTLPAPLVSDAARDVHGALTVGTERP